MAVTKVHTTGTLAPNVAALKAAFTGLGFILL